MVTVNFKHPCGELGKAILSRMFWLRESPEFADDETNSNEIPRFEMEPRWLFSQVSGVGRL